MIPNATRHQGPGSVQEWRHFVDELCNILEAARDVSPQDKLLIWQDSFGIRAARCGCRGKTYIPEAMLLQPPQWLLGV